MKILLLAEEAAGLRVLRSIAKRDIELVAVVTSRAKPGSLSSIESVARQVGCGVWRPAETRDEAFGDRLREIGIDILLNVHSLYLLSDSIISAPKIGSFNLHPGPLPQMAGLNAPSWAIYLGQKQHAVTLHWMLAGVDTGPIAYAAHFSLSDQDTGLTVSNTCVRLGVPLIEALLDTAARGRSAIPAQAQDLGLRRVFRRHDVPNDGRIIWADSARRITAFVRAADYGPFPSPWGHPKTRAGELEIGIIKARMTGEPATVVPGRVLSSSSVGVAVASGDEIVLVQTVQVNGRRANARDFMTAGDVLR